MWIIISSSLNDATNATILTIANTVVYSGDDTDISNREVSPATENDHMVHVFAGKHAFCSFVHPAIADYPLCHEFLDFPGPAVLELLFDDGRRCDCGDYLIAF